MRHSKTFHFFRCSRCRCLVDNDWNIGDRIFRTTCAAGRLDGTQCNGVGFFIETSSTHCVEFAMMMMVMVVIARVTLLWFDAVSLLTRATRWRFSILQRLMFDAAQIRNASFNLCYHVRQWVAMICVTWFVIFIVLFNASIASVPAEIVSIVSLVNYYLPLWEENKSERAYSRYDRVSLFFSDSLSFDAVRLYLWRSSTPACSSYLPIRKKGSNTKWIIRFPFEWFVGRR